MDSYEINRETIAIMSINEGVSKVIEKNEEYYVNKGSYEVMEDSCEYYGSTCDGRIKGTKSMIGSNYKVPIIIEESNEIIFFPTSAIKSENCSWIALNHIKKYENSEGFTKITFDNDKEIIIKMSTPSFEMQVLRANRLNSIMKKRQK